MNNRLEHNQEVSSNLNPITEENKLNSFNLINLNNHNETIIKNEESKPQFIRKIDILQENKINKQISALSRINSLGISYTNYEEEAIETNKIITNPSIMFQNSKFFSIDGNGRRKYQADYLADYLESIENDRAVIKIVCLILNEKKVEIFEKLYNSIGKSDFLRIFKSTLMIENEGGLVKKAIANKTQVDNCNERKTPGGVFLQLMKNPDYGVDKNLLRDIFRKDYKGYREKKKLLKNLEKMNI